MAFGATGSSITPLNWYPSDTRLETLGALVVLFFAWKQGFSPPPARGLVANPPPLEGPLHSDNYSSLSFYIDALFNDGVDYRLFMHTRNLIT